MQKNRKSRWLNGALAGALLITITATLAMQAPLNASAQSGAGLHQSATPIVQPMRAATRTPRPLPTSIERTRVTPMPEVICRLRPELCQR